MVSVTDERNIRFSLGAVGPNEALVTTAEMDTALELYPDWRLAAAFIADSLAARAISDPSSFSIPSEMSVSWPDRSKSWRETAKTLRKEVQAEQLAEGPVGLQVTQMHRAPLAPDDSEYTTERWKGLIR